AQAGTHPGRQAGTKSQQVLAVGRGADLYLGEGREHAEFVPQGAQILDAGLRLIEDPDHVAEAPTDRLKVHVVFEERGGDAPELATVLRHRGVLQLQYVDFTAVK